MIMPPIHLAEYCHALSASSWKNSSTGKLCNSCYNCFHKGSQLAVLEANPTSPSASPSPEPTTSPVPGLSPGEPQAPAAVLEDTPPAAPIVPAAAPSEQGTQGRPWQGMLSFMDWLGLGLGLGLGWGWGCHKSGMLSFRLVLLATQLSADCIQHNRYLGAGLKSVCQGT